MISRAVSPETASSDQANKLLDCIRDITTSSRSTSSNSTHHNFRAPVAKPSHKISKHFPDVDPTSSGVDYTIWLGLEKWRHRQPTRLGDVLGLAAFEQREHRDEDLTYFTRLGYWLVNDGDKLSWERHLTAQEMGSHVDRKTVEFIDAVTHGRVRLPSMGEMLERSMANRMAEKQLGLLTVARTEAQVVIDFCTVL